MKNKKICPYFIVMNDEPTCKNTEDLCFIKDYTDCILYRISKNKRDKK